MGGGRRLARRYTKQKEVSPSSTERDLPRRRAFDPIHRAGKAADLVVLAGNPAKNIDDVEKAETVFKDGVGYDPAKLKRLVEGLMACVAEGREAGPTPSKWVSTAARTE
jgi:hypothetical protein